MKKILIMLCLLILLGCSEESASPNTTSEAISGSGTTGQGGSLARFTIAKNHLYVATSSELFTYSLAKSNQPTFLKKIDLSAGVETIFSLGNYLYLGTQNGLLIFNITNASSPTFTSNYWHITSCDPVVANQNYAFVTLRDGSECRRGQNRLDVIDIRDKTNPRQVSSTILTQPIGLGIYNDLLFVCDNGSIKCFTIATPTNPLLQSVTQLAGVFDIIINRDYLLAVHSLGVAQYSIARNGTLTLQSTITTD